MFRAVISAYRLASISLRSLSLAVATAFLLSTTSLGGSPLASSTPSAFPRWDSDIYIHNIYDTTVLQRKQQQYLLFVQHETQLITSITFTFVGKIWLSFFIAVVYEYLSSLLLH